jgi:hypothetical protein
MNFKGKGYGELHIVYLQQTLGVRIKELDMIGTCDAHERE